MDDERLIVEVEQHKIIYDITHPFYKDNGHKDRAWHLIAEVLEVDADTCKARWRALRDSFVKNRKKSGLVGGIQKEWKYTDIMSFLLPYIQPRSSKINLSQLQNVEEWSGNPQSLSEFEDRSSTPQQPFTSQAPSASASAPASTSRSRSPRDRPSRPAVAAQAPQESRRGQTTDTDIGERLISLLEQPVPKPHMPDGELDEAYYFALSIVPMLHRLNKDNLQQAKLEILALLYNYERDQTSQQPPPSLG
ncbi:transcription factor Adf-1-like [Larimichthys crocea]|uniref:transcription factor Adf-1-like n=1 Tax=Larimichthys crocea TaxID=215358 RepID=UPI00090188B6|nr:transcription factor Adf-1-like [Larimichthys crocea]